MIELVSKDRCSGCSACLNSCKVGALSMETDETGFWFPKINREKCIECGACVMSCPAVDKPKYVSKLPKAYIVQNKDDEIRRQSTSGGAFTAIAKTVIVKGGVVFGAAMNAEYKVSHIMVDKVTDLSKFRNSKYVQSWIGMQFRETEKFLKAGRDVCFSGTPCQIYGLKQYLGRTYEKLLTVDFMCHSIPSPKILAKYLEYQKVKYPGFDRIMFREKGRGYSYSGMALYKDSKILYRGSSESDPWYRLFLGGYCNREACHDCLYQTDVRASDITMLDCWEPSNYAPNWDDNKGTTNLIVWTENGSKSLDVCKSDLRIKEIGIDYIDASLSRGHLPMPTYNRNQFFF